MCFRRGTPRRLSSARMLSSKKNQMSSSVLMDSRLLGSSRVEVPLDAGCMSDSSPLHSSPRIRIMCSSPGGSSMDGKGRSVEDSAGDVGALGPSRSSVPPTRKACSPPPSAPAAPSAPGAASGVPASSESTIEGSPEASPASVVSALSAREHFTPSYLQPSHTKVPGGKGAPPPAAAAAMLIESWTSAGEARPRTGLASVTFAAVLRISS
mmetsp:Transcript_96009/g.304833  ORF Transcript_96009/g.304833 Transcript_96009/m.304833 type:complete len:210 (+) Transcript_96009:482-1111(+)